MLNFSGSHQPFIAVDKTGSRLRGQLAPLLRWSTEVWSKEYQEDNLACTLKAMLSMGGVLGVSGRAPNLPIKFVNASSAEGMGLERE